MLKKTKNGNLVNPINGGFRGTKTPNKLQHNACE